MTIDAPDRAPGGGVRIGSRRLPPVLAGAGLASIGIALILAVGLTLDRLPLSFDTSIVLGLRHWGGPVWLRHAAMDITALGGVTVLTIIVIATAALLLAERLWLTAAATIVSCWSVSWAVALLKMAIARPRPSIVPHLVEVQNASFPSGHAAGSAAVYITLAALATQVLARPATRRTVVILAILLVGAIGCSRVYLGVHWPSDVLAGWSFGTLWALGWWTATAKARQAIGGER